MNVPSGKLLTTAKPIYVYPAFALEGYPNRDSTPYDKRYNIPEAHTILRGTLRYQGNPKFMQTLQDLGLLDDAEQPHLAPDAPPLTWAESLSKRLGCAADNKTLRAEVVKRAGLEGEMMTRILNGMNALGFFSTTEQAPRKGTFLDSLAATLQAKMTYQEGERDMVLLQHKFEIELADGVRVRASRRRGLRFVSFRSPWSTPAGDAHVDPSRVRRAQRHNRHGAHGRRSVRHCGAARP